MALSEIMISPEPHGSPLVATPKRNHLRRDPLAPYPRCRCGKCKRCLDNDKWDRIFAKFIVEHREERGLFQSSLRDL